MCHCNQYYAIQMHGFYYAWIKFLMPPLEPPNRVQRNLRIESYDKEVQTRRWIHKEHQKQKYLGHNNDIVGLASVRDNMNRL